MAPRRYSSFYRCGTIFSYDDSNAIWAAEIALLYVDEAARSENRIPIELADKFAKPIICLMPSAFSRTAASALF